MSRHDCTGLCGSLPGSFVASSAPRSPAARASVIWLIGQYQSDIPFLAPDALRRLVASFDTEKREVKLQTLSLAIKAERSGAALERCGA